MISSDAVGETCGMWTTENRARYERRGLRYPSDLADEEWALIRPLIPPAKRGGNKRTVDVRAVVNGVMYVLSDYFKRWDWDGTLERVHHALYVACREIAGRQASPTVAIIDSQSVKSTEKGGVRSIRPVTTPEKRSKARSGMSSSIRRVC